MTQEENIIYNRCIQTMNHIAHIYKQKIITLSKQVAHEIGEQIFTSYVDLVKTAHKDVFVNFYHEGFDEASLYNSLQFSLNTNFVPSFSLDSSKFIFKDIKKLKRKFNQNAADEIDYDNGFDELNYSEEMSSEDFDFYNTDIDYYLAYSSMEGDEYIPTSLEYCTPLQEVFQKAKVESEKRWAEYYPQLELEILIQYNINI